MMERSVRFNEGVIPAIDIIQMLPGYPFMEIGFFNQGECDDSGSY